MTFTEISQDICDRLGFTHSTDTARVGRAINRKYKEITASLGIKHVSRRSTVQATCTLGVSTLQFTSAEKLINVFNRNVSPYKQLEEVSIDELEAQMPFDASDTPTQYAIQQIASDSVTILLNCTPQTALVLYADVYSTTATLSGSDEPAFSESYHDILISAVLIDEYLKVEKPSLSKVEKENVYGPQGRPEEGRLAQLRHWYAVSTTKKQHVNKQNETAFAGVSGSGGSSGSAFDGSQSWTQSGLITFNRGAGVAPFAVFDSTLVTNLNAQFLQGLTPAQVAALAAFDEAANHTNTGTWTFAGTLGLNGVVTMGANLLFSADNTKDIGASGATRPRDLFLGRNAAIGGTLGVIGVTTLQGNLLFSADNTLDIGAAGATRPRDFHIGRNGLIGGTLGVTGVLTATAQAVFTGAFQTGAAIAYVNDSANTGMTTGITVNQGAADNEIISLKSSDVAHAVTDVAETDTFAAFRKSSAASGGLQIDGLSGTFFFGIRGRAVITGNADTTKATNAAGIFQFDSYQKSGTGVGAVVANGNLACFGNQATTRFILDGDGDSHQDVGTAWTNFDDDDDIKRMDAVAIALARENDPLRHEFVKDFESRRSIIEAMPGKALVQFNEDGHHFVNMSRLSMLHHGAIRQIAREIHAFKEDINGSVNELKRLLTHVGGEGRAALSS